MSGRLYTVPLEAATHTGLRTVRSSSSARWYLYWLRFCVAAACRYLHAIR
jgi:hypothetical protein